MIKRDSKAHKIIRSILLLILLSWGLMGLWMLFQEWSPSRTITETSGISLLWSRKLDSNINSEQAQIFSPYDGSVILHANDFLLSFDIIDGRVLWKTEVPSSVVVRFYDNKLFVTSNKQSEMAPTTIDQYTYYCNAGSRVSLSTYDARTGEQLWKYRYNGVYSSDLKISEQDAYLFGSGDHGATRSLAQVNVNTGELLMFTCARRYEDEEILSIPDSEAVTGDYLSTIWDESDVRSREYEWTSIIDSNRLTILNGSKEILGAIEFDGFRLNQHGVGIAIFDDIIVVYLSDSHQLFGFHFD